MGVVKKALIRCGKCTKDFLRTGYAQKLCPPCGREATLQKMRDRHKATYTRKGYNQLRENNNNWTGGIGIYRRLKKGDCCERCKSKRYLLVHHRDENRYNNTPENLEILCKRCHQLEHACIGNLPEMTPEMRAKMSESAKNRKKTKVCKV